MILLRDIKTNVCLSLEQYEARGGYEALRKSLRMTPEEIIGEIKRSGLRGRGGAGFPTGAKWSYIPANNDKPHYLLCNADEGEPGTFKDRLLLQTNPHMILEGMLIAALATRSKCAIIYIRGEYVQEAKLFEQAIADAAGRGHITEGLAGAGAPVKVIVHRGAGSYICGEETALIESIEGKRGCPRLKPPFPAVSGVFGCPTIVNNVETLANVPWIMLNGAEPFRKYGTEKSPGTKLFCVSGRVQLPGVYELPFGESLMDLIENQAGGMQDGFKLKAVIPGGASTPILTAQEARRATLDFEALAQIGTMLGSGAVIVIHEGASIPDLCLRLTHFYADESCGQCTPCREGVAWISKILRNLIDGKGSRDDVAKILDICEGIIGMTLCPGGEAAAIMIKGMVSKFRDEFEACLKDKRR